MHAKLTFIARYGQLLLLNILAKNTICQSKPLLIRNRDINRRSIVIFV